MVGEVAVSMPAVTFGVQPATNEEKGALMVSTRLELVREAIQNCQSATAKVSRHRSDKDPAIKELADAVHFLSFGVQQIGLALSDEGRHNDLPGQRGK